MLESAVDAYASTIPPYGLLITRIFHYYSINLSVYPMVEVSTTYDSKTFAIMGYVMVDKEWYKDSVKAKSDLLKVRKFVYNPMLPILKELGELKDRIKTIEKGLFLLQEPNSKIL